MKIRENTPKNQWVKEEIKIKIKNNLQTKMEAQLKNHTGFNNNSSKRKFTVTNAILRAENILKTSIFSRK